MFLPVVAVLGHISVTLKYELVGISSKYSRYSKYLDMFII